MSVSIEINGAKEFRAALKKAPEFATKEIRKAIYSSGEALKGKVKLRAPVKTGALRTSIQSSYNASKLSASVSSALEYAAYLEGGTRAHGPVTAPYLVFNINGHWVRAKRVRGIKARKFFKQGFDDAQHLIQGYFDAAIAAITKFLAEA